MKKIMALMTAVFIVVLSVSPAFAYDFNGFTSYAWGEMGGITDPLLDRYNEGYTYFTMVSIDSNETPLLLQSDNPFRVSEDGKSLYTTVETRIYRWGWMKSSSDAEPTWKPNPSSLLIKAANETYTYGTSDVNTVKWTSYDIYDVSGDFVMAGDSGFFPTPPLAEVIQGVTAETLTSQTVPTVTGTMKTVVLCGVGCLALLTVLVLLPKKFWMFLR